MLATTSPEQSVALMSAALAWSHPLRLPRPAQQSSEHVLYNDPSSWHAACVSHQSHVCSPSASVWSTHAAASVRSSHHVDASAREARAAHRAASAGVRMCVENWP